MAHVSRQSRSRGRTARRKRQLRGRRIGAVRSPRVDRPETTPEFGGTQVHGVYIERMRPGEGFRHVLRKRDVVAFIELLPDWAALSEDLDAIVLAPGQTECFGWYEPGMVAVGAWPRTRQVILDDAWVEESRPVLERLEVPMEAVPGSRWRLTFDDRSARGFLLLDVLLHELGHHHDRIHTRSQYECSRGEPYAMAYAEERTEELWEAYQSVFGP